MKFFKQIDLIQYNGKYSRNLLTAGKINDEIFEKYKVFYDYTIKDGIRPDYVAEKYYGDPYNIWIIYFSNKVLNPFNFWPLDHDEFIRFIEKKHGKSYQTLMSETNHYVYTGVGGDTAEEIARKNWKMTPETYAELSTSAKSGWTAVDTYSHEENLNEAKRNIKLISNEYTEQITNELGNIFNG